MCGILAAFWRAEAPIPEPALRRAVGTMARRGPDNQALLLGEGYALGHARLSIIDLSQAANQPFADPTGRWLLTYNGEIYNYRELAADLERRGQRLRTRSDTEVLLSLLLLNGPEETLRRVRGMFAFVLLDRETGRFLAARDHFGQKPLYYAATPDWLALASDQNALLALAGTPEPDLDAFELYLSSHGIVGPSDSFFAGVRCLPAGHFLEGGRDRAISIRRYFSVVDLIDAEARREAERGGLEASTDRLDELVAQAVGRHLVSDVPVGILLSGGIDSSLVYAYTRAAGADLTCFTKITPGIEAIPDTIVPQLLRGRAEVRAVRLTETVGAYLPGMLDFIAYSGAPSRWGGGPPMYNLCRAARSAGIHVLLGGDAVDEYAAGYKSFASLVAGFDGDLMRLHEILDLEAAAGASSAAAGFLAEQHAFRRDILDRLGHIADPRERFAEAVLLHDTGMFLQCCNLPHSDAYSMAASTELRNPYLDMDMVRFVVNLPLAHKWDEASGVHGSKFLFRRLAQRKLGPFVDVEKEGTRNYSMAISDPDYWNLERFRLRDLGFDRLPRTRKALFKWINLEAFYRRFFLGSGGMMEDAMTAIGRSALGQSPALVESA